MKKKNMKFKEAIKFVKSKRDIINPNEGFIEQLKVYEKFLFEKNKE
jgi:hypothetical protein